MSQLFPINLDGSCSRPPAVAFSSLSVRPVPRRSNSRARRMAKLTLRKKNHVLLATQYRPHPFSRNGGGDLSLHTSVIFRIYRFMTHSSSLSDREGVRIFSVHFFRSFSIARYVKLKVGIGLGNLMLPVRIHARAAACVSTYLAEIVKSTDLWLHNTPATVWVCREKGRYSSSLSCVCSPVGIVAGLPIY